MKRFIVIEVDDTDDVERIVRKLKWEGFVRYIAVQESWKKKLEDILKNLKVGATYKGYNEMFIVMNVFCENPEYQNYFNLKDIYDADSRLNKSNTERRIRYLIEMIQRNSSEQIEKILGKDAVGDISVKKFIALMVYKLFKEEI